MVFKTDNVILASGSPRRKELMQRLFKSFRIIPSSFEEVVNPEMTPKENAEWFALKKSEEVFNRHPDSLTIGADTIVVVDKTILGKPSGPEEAEEMLRRLSGRKHYVITGVCILSHKLQIVFTSCSEVYFSSMSDSEIKQYIQTGEPMDKAGAYGIQGMGGLFVEKIKGDYNNIVGFPLSEIYKRLKTIIH